MVFLATSWTCVCVLLYFATLLSGGRSRTEDEGENRGWEGAQPSILVGGHLFYREIQVITTRARQCVTDKGRQWSFRIDFHVKRKLIGWNLRKWTGGWKTSQPCSKNKLRFIINHTIIFLRLLPDALKEKHGEEVQGSAEAPGESKEILGL